MANAKDVFIVCFVLSFVGNVISGLSGKQKNPEKMMGLNTLEAIENRFAEMIEMEMNKLKGEIKQGLAFDLTAECKKINERNENDVKRSDNFDNIVIEDWRKDLKNELMTELNQSISSAVPRAVRDLPYLVTCAYKVCLAQPYKPISRHYDP